MSPVMNDLAFEDFKLGPLGRFGPRHVTAEEIRAFVEAIQKDKRH